jgi:hypothetical protein
MKIHPKVVPLISRETIQLLMQDGDIEVEPKRIADAELDLSAIMREYLTNEERVNQAAREALERRGYDHSKFDQVKREMAEVRGFKLGDEGIESVVGDMVDFLLLSRNVEEVFAPDSALRPKILAVMKRHLDVDEETDRQNRSGGSDPGGMPPLPPAGEPGGGAPAEARVSDEPPRPRRPEAYPERGEREPGNGSDG